MAKPEFFVEKLHTPEMCDCCGSRNDLVKFGVRQSMADFTMSYLCIPCSVELAEEIRSFVIGETVATCVDEISETVATFVDEIIAFKRQAD